MQTSISHIDKRSSFLGFSAKSRRSPHAPLFKRLTSLDGVLQKLQAGQFVSNRSLSRHLTEDEFQAYLNLCQQQRDLREKLKNKPAEVDAYQLDLKRADFYAIQATAYQDQGDADNAEVFLKLSQKQNQIILNKLKQQIQLQASLQDWFDRPVLAISEQVLTADNMPRVVTSFSRFKLDNHPFAIISVAKQDIKIKAIRDAQKLLSTTLSELISIGTL